MTFDEFAADLPLGRTEWFTSPEALEKVLMDTGVYQPTRQTKRGEFRAGLAFRATPHAELFADRYSTSISLHLQTPQNAAGILIPKSVSGHFIVNGINLADDHLLYSPDGAGSDISGPGPIGSDDIAIPRERFSALLDTLCPSTCLPDEMAVVEINAPMLRMLGDSIVSLVGADEGELQGEQLPNLIAWIVSLIGHASRSFRPDDPNGLGARSRVARNAQEFIEANFHQPVHLENLCRETGVGIRTLQRCFREYFDLSVTDYIKTVRLDAAYRELKAANGEGNTVTKIALQNGFTHLGRFSVAYHVRFGEMPSETLAAMPGTN